MSSETGVQDGLNVRAGTAADTDRILELVKLSLGEGLVPRDPAYWWWKHHENPFGESPVLLAEANGELVGLRVFMRWTWDFSGRQVRAVRAVDTATHPKWQGRGIFRTLTLALVERMRDEGVHFIFNTPNNQSRPGYLKMGWRAVGRVDPWIRLLRPLRMARIFASRSRNEGGGEDTRQHLEGPSAPLDELLSPRSELSTWLQARPIPASDPRLTVPCTAEYLRWRYAAVPGFKYHALAEVDQRSGAVVVFRLKHQGRLSELRVCELIVGAGAHSRKIARTLLARLRRTVDADYISAMPVGGAAAERILLRAGFLPVPRLGPILTVLPLNPIVGGLDPLRRAGWRPSLGDMELF